MIRLIRWLLGLCPHHDDAVIGTKELQSAFAQANTANVIKFEVEDIGPGFFSATFITIVRCKNCGRVQHITTRGPT